MFLSNCHEFRVNYIKSSFLNEKKLLSFRGRVSSESVIFTPVLFDNNNQCAGYLYSFAQQSKDFRL